MQSAAIHSSHPGHQEIPLIEVLRAMERSEEMMTMTSVSLCIKGIPIASHVMCAYGCRNARSVRRASAMGREQWKRWVVNGAGSVSLVRCVRTLKAYSCSWLTEFDVILPGL